MLARLYIQNYALIDELELNPGPGLNIITGETGAGKSIVVGALGLILGNRADSTVILDPERKCVVEAEFQLKDNRLKQQLEAADIDDMGSQLIIRRELTPQGKSRAFINDTPTTLQVLKEITGQLVDLHSQRDGLLILDEGHQLKLLDQYAGIEDEVATFAKALGGIRTLETERTKLINEKEKASSEAEFRNFQLNELTEANLQEGEDEAVEQELMAGQNRETVTEALGAAIDELRDSETAAATILATSLKSMERVSAYVNGLPEELEKLKEAQVLIEDATSQLQQYLENLDIDPERLQLLEARHDLYTKLKLKYKLKSAEELIELRDSLADSALSLADADKKIIQLDNDIAAEYKILADSATSLENKRNGAAFSLAQKVSEQLEAVALKHAEFEILLDRTYKENGALTVDGKAIQPQTNGINTISFRVKTNPGTPFGTLSNVASGGELSRIMLALKAALAEKTHLPLLIFDEIDTGISGEVALKVGQVMEVLARQHQLITISHLPQIASRPGKHYHIYKEVMNGNTHTRLRALGKEERVEELARMVSGDNPGEAALASARELMQ